MSTKAKAFIGIIVSFAILIILFASNGGFRGARAAEEEAVKRAKHCSVAENVPSNENIAKGEADQAEGE